MRPDRFGDFVVRFLGVSEMLDKATKLVPHGSAPPPAGALDEARRHMFELRGEARQLIVQMGEETAAAAEEPASPYRPQPKGKAERAEFRRRRQIERLALSDDERVFLSACWEFARRGTKAIGSAAAFVVMMPGYPGSGPVVRASGLEIIRQAIRFASAGERGAR